MVQGTGRPAGKRHTLGWAMAFCWSHKSPKPHAYALGPAERFFGPSQLAAGLGDELTAFLCPLVTLTSA